MLEFSNFKKRHSANGSARQSGPADQVRPGAPPYDAAALETLIARAERAAEQLRALDASTDRAAQLAAVEERLAGLEQAAAGVQRLNEQVASTQERTTRLSDSQERAEADITAVGTDIERARTSAGDLLTKIDAALELRTQLDGFLTLKPQVTSLRTDADALTTRMRDLTDTVDRFRAVHEDAVRAHKHATNRLDGVDQRYHATASKMDSIERRASSSEQALTALLNLARGIPEVHHQLTMLKAIADQVTQKTAMVEQQRDGVDRIASQVAHVLSLTSQLEAAFRQQEEQAKALGSIDAKLAEVQSQHATVLSRMVEIGTTQRQLDDTERAAERALNALRAEMQTSTERFELENQGLDAVSERIASLRGNVKECETRIATVTAVAGAIGETETRSRALAEQVAEIAEDVGRIAAQAERLRDAREDAGTLDRTVAEIAQRMERVESARPMLDAITHDLAALNGVHEAVRDGLEQVRTAYVEMTRLREGKADTEAWLADADGRMNALRAHVADLERMRPAVDAVRGQVDRLSSATAAIEGRGAMVEDLNRRVGQLATTVTQLHDRGEAVSGRMDAAELKFVELSRQAGEAQRVATTIESVSSAVEEADRRLESVGGAIEGLERRAKSLDGLGDRIRLLGQDLDQRQGALDKATEHLARASALRRESADVAQQLESLSHGITTQLGAADSRTSTLERLLHDVEGRVVSLGDVEKRMGNFEDLLGQWETAQTAAAYALEQISSRQGMLDAVQSQITHLGEIAERTAEDVRSITAARREVEETRTLLNSTQDRLQRAADSMQDVTERQHQIEHLEQRLARADALAATVRSTVEVIAAQRSVVGQAMERAGTLALQMKQAEALSEALRNQCQLAAELRDAVDEVREEDAATEEEEVPTPRRRSARSA